MHNVDYDPVKVVQYGPRNLPCGLLVHKTSYAPMIFMYRRPILWTLYNALDFLKVLKIPVVKGGGMLLVHSAYIMSLLMMAGIKYWDVMYMYIMSQLMMAGIKYWDVMYTLTLNIKKVLAPSKCPLKWLIKLLSHKKNYVPQFLKQRDVNTYYSVHIQYLGKWEGVVPWKLRVFWDL